MGVTDRGLISLRAANTTAAGALFAPAYCRAIDEKTILMTYQKGLSWPFLKLLTKVGTSM